MKFLSLRWKISGILLLSNLFLGILLVIIVNSNVTSSLETELIERGRTVATDIARFSAPQIIDSDEVGLKQIITKSLSSSSESMEYIIIYDENYQILTDTYNAQVPIEIAQKRIEDRVTDIPEIINIPALNVACYDIIVPVEDGDVGYVRTGMKTGYIEEKVAKSINFIIVTIALVTLIGILITYFLAARITSPIIYLTERANEISKGKLEEKIVADTNDEIKYLAEAVERLRESLNLALVRLKKHQSQRV